jgi:hypothetical protein
VQLALWRGVERKHVIQVVIKHFKRRGGRSKDTDLLDLLRETLAKTRVTSEEVSQPLVPSNFVRVNVVHLRKRLGFLLHLTRQGGCLVGNEALDPLDKLVFGFSGQASRSANRSLREDVFIDVSLEVVVVGAWVDLERRRLRSLSSMRLQVDDAVEGRFPFLRRDRCAACGKVDDAVAV